MVGTLAQVSSKKKKKKKQNIDILHWDSIYGKRTPLETCLVPVHSGFLVVYPEVKILPKTVLRRIQNYAPLPRSTLVYILSC